jgi:hypothetical protein
MSKKQSREEKLIASLRAKVLYLEGQLAEERQRYESAEFWTKSVYPEGMKPEDVQNELKDYQFLMDAASRVYCHVTDGMISKTNTLPSVVIAVHDDKQTEHYNQALKDARDEIVEVLNGMIG